MVRFFSITLIIMFSAFDQSSACPRQELIDAGGAIDRDTIARRFFEKGTKEARAAAIEIYALDHRLKISFPDIISILKEEDERLQINGYQAWQLRAIDFDCNSKEVSPYFKKLKKEITDASLDMREDGLTLTVAKLMAYNEISKHHKFITHYEHRKWRTHVLAPYLNFIYSLRTSEKYKGEYRWILSSLGHKLVTKKHFSQYLDILLKTNPKQTIEDLLVFLHTTRNLPLQSGNIDDYWHHPLLFKALKQKLPDLLKHIEKDITEENKKELSKLIPEIYKL